MKIYNKTDHTISFNFFNKYRELPVGWELNENDVGGRETLMFIAFKYPNEVRLCDDDGKEVEFINCPLCGHLTKIEDDKKEVIKYKKGSKK